MTILLEVKALPVTVPNLITAVLQSPATGPYPRLATHKGNAEVEIPHFLRPATKETLTSSAPLPYGVRVVVYTQGITATR